MTTIEHPLPPGVVCPACASPLSPLVGYAEVLDVLRRQFADPKLSGWVCSEPTCRAFVAISPRRKELVSEHGQRFHVERGDRVKIDASFVDVRDGVVSNVDEHGFQVEGRNVWFGWHELVEVEGVAGRCLPHVLGSRE